MEQFLASVEKQAYRTALLAVKNVDDALDVVQESMMRMVTHYQSKPREEWKPLFWKVVYSQINEWHRKQQKTKGWLSWFGGNADSHQDSNGIHSSDYGSINNGSIDYGPEEFLEADRAIKQIMDTIGQLPVQQQQAFLLRHWQNFSTQETADIMGISTGSVKTHLSRAVQQLDSVTLEANP